MTIQFQSDPSVTGTGFLLEWYAEDASAVTRAIARGGFSVVCVVKSAIDSDILSFTEKNSKPTSSQEKALAINRGKAFTDILIRHFNSFSKQFLGTLRHTILQCFKNKHVARGAFFFTQIFHES